MIKLCFNALNNADLSKIGVLTSGISKLNDGVNGTEGLKNDINKAGRVGDVNLTISGPESNDAQPVQTVNVAPGETPQQAIQNQANKAFLEAGNKIKAMKTN